MLNEEVQRVAEKSVLCWFASVDENGNPNVSPKEIWKIIDNQHIVIANIASPTTVHNIISTGKACVSFIDIFVQKGFKVTGSCRNIARENPEFISFAMPLLKVAEPRFHVRSVLLLKVNNVAPILAPSYVLYPSETSESGQIHSAMQTYGVRPLQNAT